MKIIFLLFALSLCCISCKEKTAKNPTIVGNNILVQREIEIADFSDIEINGAYNIIFIQDSLKKIQVEGESNIIHLIDIYSNQNKLIVKNKDNYTFEAKQPISITLHHNGVNILDTKGNSSINFGEIYCQEINTSINGSGFVTGSLSGQNIRFTLSGSGTIDVSVKCNTLEASVMGNGTYIFKGNAREGVYDVSGIGNIDASELLTNKTWCTTSGIGDTHLNVSDELHANISGTGNIYYSGSPELDVEITGVGKVIKLED